MGSKIKRTTINSEQFERLVLTYGAIHLKDGIQSKFHGYKDFRTLYYGRLSNNTYLTIRNKYLGDLKVDNNDNSIIVCQVVDDDRVTNKQSKNGREYYLELMKLINKYYGDAFKELSHYQATYSSDLNQKHFFAPLKLNTIYEFPNCYYYDLNGAYCSALIEMLPKCKEELIKLYNKKYEDISYKNLYCFAVGYFVRSGLDKTYNYIVQKVRRIIDEAIDQCVGKLLYANTDGFIVYNPEFPMEHTSKVVGEWKLEYQGNCYMYCQNLPEFTPYNVLVIGDKMTGSIRNKVRNYVRLSERKVPAYNLEREYIDYGRFGAISNENWFMKVTNVKEIEICQEEYIKEQE